MALTYKISSWTQIGECLSNTDKKLHAVCSKIVSTSLQGLVVRVEHEDFGCLFSYLVDGSGPAISDQSITPLSTQEILDQLRRLGFYIIYEEEKQLPGSLLNYLITLDGLEFDKIRILYVDMPAPMPGEDVEPKYYVVAFKVKDHPEWIHNTYRATEDEIIQGTMAGTAINVSAMSEKLNFNWGFLKDYVLNIKDILEENSQRD